MWAVNRLRPLLFHRLLSTMRSIADSLHRRCTAPPTSRSPYAGESFAVALSGSSPLPWPSLVHDKLGFLFFRFGQTFRRCQACSQAIHFLLRAAVLLSFLRKLHRFSTTSHPAALDACYLASGLRASKTVTRIGLSPASRRQLSGHTKLGWVALSHRQIEAI